MIEDIQTTIDSGVELLHRLALKDETLRLEFEKSVGEFFPGGAPSLENPLEAVTSARRHVEWFLFERWSPALLDLPVEKLQEGFLEQADEAQLERRDAFLNSFTGIFEVRDVVPGEGMRLEDLGGLTPVAAFEERGAESFEVGDLIVGRVYPLGDGIHHVSRAAALFRDASLLTALKKDIERIRDERDRAVFRIAQRELEAMFFSGAEDVSAPSGAPEVSAADAVRKARETLESHGVQGETVNRILATLEVSPPPLESLVLGAGDALGDLLDELAFETDVDLDLTRRVLLVAWRAMHVSPPQEPSQKKSGESPKHSEPVVVNGIVQHRSTPGIERALGSTKCSSKPANPRTANEGDEVGPELAAAVERFDSLVASGGDLCSALNELEAELALEEGETEPESPIPNDFPDVVTAMVEEYLWELGAVQSEADARSAQSLRAFGKGLQHVDVFEDLSREDVISYLTVHLPEQHAFEPALDGEDLEEHVQAVLRFCTWAAENHELEHLNADSFPEHLQAIAASLPRTLELRGRFNAVFEPSLKDGSETLGQVVLNDGEALVLEGPGGRAARFELEGTPSATHDLLDELQNGDVLRVRTQESALLVESLLPAEAALLWSGALKG